MPFERRLAVCWAVAATWAIWSAPRGALAAGYAPRIDKPPNIVLVVVDSLRADRLGCYGHARKTSPRIDRLAKEGVLLTRCYSPASWTVPSVTSMLTGLMPSVHGCDRPAVTLPAKISTFPEALRSKGYYCAAVISNSLLKGKYGFARGFDKYDDQSVFREIASGAFAAGGDPPIIAEITEKDVPTGAAVTRQARKLWRQAVKAGKPVFLLVFYYDPHYDYAPPPPYATLFDADYRGRATGRGLNPRISAPPPADLKHLAALYDGEIAYEDNQIGQLIDEFDGAAGNTLIIVTADHGEAFGEHGQMTHGYSAYQEETRIPMIWRWKGVLPQGHRVEGPVSTLDIATTLRDLIEFKQMALTQGRSLWAGLRGGQMSDRRLVITDKASRRGSRHLALSRGQWRLHARFGDKPGLDDVKFELYDAVKDPFEKAPIAPGDATVGEQLTSAVLRHLAECAQLRRHFDQGQPTNKQELSEDEQRRLENLGYISGKAKTDE